jgi:hypothetical protein
MINLAALEPIYRARIIRLLEVVKFMNSSSTG